MRYGLMWASALLFMAVGAAMVTQLYFGWEPCVMCVEIRAGLLGMGLALGVASVLPFSPIRRALLAIGILSGGWTCKISGDLFALEQGWIDSFGCSPFARFPSWLPLHEWIPLMFQPQSICGDAPKSLIGVPLSLWPILIVIMAVALLVKHKRHI